MTKQKTVLYPVDYTEPPKAQPVEDTAEFGRDFQRLRQIINGAVPPGGEPMTLAQLARIVRGAPDRGGGMVFVATDPPNMVRDAARNPVMGITSDPTVRSITRDEARAEVDKIWLAREPTWNFNEVLEESSVSIVER